MRSSVSLRAAAMILLAAVLFSGCGASKEEEEKPKKSPKALVLDEGKGENEKKEDKFHFRDVKGVEYEAELRQDVPKASYDYSRLTDENGLKYYKDESGKVVSELGIDVSEYQKSVDFKKVKEAGISFAIIRVGYRGYGADGKLVEDALFRQHMQGAKDAGLKLGVYFFSQAVTKEETLEEAVFVKERIQDYDLAYPVVFDTEEITYDTSRTEGLSREQFTDNCITFCDDMKEAGYETMIYANMKWMAFTLQLEKLTGYAKWYADYEPTPQCPYEFQIWQYTEKGSLPGVEGNIDLNIAFSH